MDLCYHCQPMVPTSLWRLSHHVGSWDAAWYLEELRMEAHVMELQVERQNELELEKLRDQNRSLRVALSSMKEMMESMGQSVPTAVSVDSPRDNGNMYTC
ncbi:hypothetical protein ACOMHN_042111 [Nucella lapillus]